jgi:mRNA-degrading endonuclease RelE of RelBE toxin-antitoxin system
MISGKNTTYRVEITVGAALDLALLYEQINADGSPAAAAWFNDLQELIFALDHLPDRGTITPESRRFRQLLHGNKPDTYRVIYSVNHSAKVVSVRTIRHSARSPMPAE